MGFLYNIGIRLYYILVWLSSPFNDKARYWIRGRKDLFQRIKSEISEEDQIVWFHAASLGEFEQGRPVIEAWKEHFPETKILLTFFSPSGYEIRKDYKGADYIYYLPLDTRLNARKFVQLIKPEYAIFIKYEFWHYMLNEAKAFGTKLILVSAIFRQEQIFFKSYGEWFKNMLFSFNHIFVQDENSLRLLSQFKDLPISIAGDTRFDRVAQIAAEAKSNIIVEEFSKDRFTYVFGSTWEQDENLIIQYINDNTSDSCFIIAPHEIGESHIHQIVKRLHKNVGLYSQTTGREPVKAKVLIIDNIGLLSSLYQYGNVAYIGGGFGTGIHNVLEPAVNGMPVIFGPKYQKFREAVELVRDGGAFPIKKYDELKIILDQLKGDTRILKETGKATKKFVQRNMGASEVILNYIRKN